MKTLKIIIICSLLLISFSINAQDFCGTVYQNLITQTIHVADIYLSIGMIHFY